MTEPMLHSRAEVFGSAFPTSSSGEVRPALAANRPVLTIHYVGSGTFIDSGDTPNEMRAIHAWSTSSAKATPWEYNYVVDGDGELWTYAGERVAAHSAGNNTTSIGVLALAGLNDPVPDAMVLGLRKLRWLLQNVGLLAPNHQLLPHRQMPGANTSCPGPQVLARWGEIAEPWSPQPDPQPIVEEAMYRYVQVPGDLAVYKVSGVYALWVQDGNAVRDELVGAPGGAIQSVERYVLKAYQLIGAGPFGIPGVTTVPADFNSWKP